MVDTDNIVFDSSKFLDVRELLEDVRELIIIETHVLGQKQFLSAYWGQRIIL